MVKKHEPESANCPVEITLNVIGGRWKVLIIHFLLNGTMRFGELSRSLGGVAARTLSKQLRELEEDGVVERKDYREIPPRVDYSLTPLGLALKPILLAMETWALSVKKLKKTKRTSR